MQQGPARRWASTLFGIAALGAVSHTPARAQAVDQSPVTFSVDGPVDPNTEGIRYARGTAVTPQVPVQPGNPIGAGIRIPAVPQATGIATPWPGDVLDYLLAPVASEAIFFQSPPFAGAMPPDGTNNQILEAAAAGLAAGPGVPRPGWIALNPNRDNVDAISFGEDYFPNLMEPGWPDAPALPLPPMAGGKIVTAATPWAARMSIYREPIIRNSAPGVSFRFSVDPWAIGAAATAVLAQSGGMDAGGGLGPWMSPGKAAGDVFGTPLLGRAAGLTLGAAGNSLVHDEPTLALLAPLPTQEDDLDGLECVGDNNDPWFMPAPLPPGDLHGRVDHFGPVDPAGPGMSIHNVSQKAPVFFSVTRSSPGVPFTAVRSQFVIDGGASADVFLAVDDPANPNGIGTNLLFADEAEIGLYAASDPASMMPSPADESDDLDALVLWLDPPSRQMVSLAIEEILGMAAPFVRGGMIPWALYGAGDAVTGGGMTISIVQYLAMTGRPLPSGSVKVGFSVTTDSQGLEYSAVDWEAGAVFPAGSPSQSAGDVFFSVPDGTGVNSNWLWFEEVDLGLDPGAWVNGVSIDLALLADNLDGLDTIDQEPHSTVGVEPSGSQGTSLRLAAPSPNPAGRTTSIRFTLPAAGRVQLSVHDAGGREVARLLDEDRAAGDHAVSWDTERAGDLASGVYFVHLSFGGMQRQERLVLMKSDR